MRRRRLLATLVLAAALATACGGDDPQPAPSPSPSAAVPAPSPSPSPTPTPVAVAPLTGEPVTDAAVLQRPVMAVKIENTKPARPQAGLDEADIVYEEIVEGGVTRFIALFQSTVPETVGPVRSARLVDVQVLPAYGGFLAYSGARDEVTGALQRAGIPLLIDDGGDAFFRDRGRSRSHDLMGRGPRLYEKGTTRDGVRPADPVFSYATTPPPGAVTCPAEDATCGERIAIRMSAAATAGWTYDAADGTYRRDQNGVPTEVVGEGRVGAANVVALGMRVGPGGCCDAAGSRFVETQVVGEGPAIVLRDGRRYAATWRKASASGDLTLLDGAGRPFPLKPGATWIHLAPQENLPG